MHGGQQCPERDDKEHHLVEVLQRFLPSEPFEHHGRKLQRHYPDVDGHTDGGFKQHRVGVEETGNVEVRQVPVTTYVDGDGQPTQRVAEQARQQRRTHQG